MRSTVVAIPAEEIVEWPSFHEVFKRALGFPEFYGGNMNAWIDCMTSVDTPEDRLSAVTVGQGEVLILRIRDPAGFRKRCPDQYEALIECTACVNHRRTELGEPPVLAILLDGRYD